MNTLYAVRVLGSGLWVRVQGSGPAYEPMVVKQFWVCKETTGPLLRSEFGIECLGSAASERSGNYLNYSYRKWLKPRAESGLGVQVKVLETVQAVPSSLEIGRTWSTRRSLQTYLTQCIHQLVFESQLPHKIVNLLSAIAT